jgi:hypothetical protein
MQGTVRVVKLSIQTARVEFHIPVEKPGLSLTGFVIGPQCPGRTTVEIPYPIRTIESESPSELIGQVNIPEPCIWSEAAPFEYLARLEIRDGETVIEKDGVKFQL